MSTRVFQRMRITCVFLISEYFAQTSHCGFSYNISHQSESLKIVFNSFILMWGYNQVHLNLNVLSTLGILIRLSFL